VQLPPSLRESLVVELDVYLEAFGVDPDAEAVAVFVTEALEIFADENGHEDLIGDLEDAGAIDGTLQEALEGELESNGEFEFTGEEVTSLLERIAGIIWDDDGLGVPEESQEEDYL
jgi:hypothetical protein